jgi:hypothetical protein
VKNVVITQDASVTNFSAGVFLSLFDMVRGLRF